jgi:hypothetical protein
MTMLSAHAPRRSIRIRYAVAGLILAVAWVWRENTPAWEHALRVLVVLLVIVPTVRWARQRRAAASGGAVGPPFLTRTLVLAKLTLVVAGLGVEWALERWMPRTDAAACVAVALGLAIAIGGPYLQRRSPLRSVAGRGSS